MGNLNNPENKTDQYADFSLVSFEQVEGLGKYEIYEDRVSGKHYLVFESSYAISNPEMAESAVTQLKKIEAIRNSCKLVTQTVGKSKILCFDNYSINLCFEYYSSSLASMANLRLQGTQISEPEIWAVAEDLVQYLGDLQKFDICHGDLQPKHILFNKNKIVKVLCPLLYTVYENAYKLKLANEAYKSAFAPEELEAFEMRQTTPDINPSKCDIFSLGICLLVFIRGGSIDQFYNWTLNQIDMNLVHKENARVYQDDKLSEELFFFINVCTKENPAERADLELLLKVISKRQSKNRSDDKVYW